MVLSDIEIANSVQMKPITDIAAELGLTEDDISLYGKYKAKIDSNQLEQLKDKEDGKLILVTAISPTPAGEGKTTTSVGLVDALSAIGEKAVIALPWPCLWDQGWSCRWRVRPSGSNGRYQPSLYRRFPCHWDCQQPPCSLD